MKENKIYWKGLEQLEDSNEFQKRIQKEFPEYLPISNNESEGTSRRDFLKLMGFSLAAASVAACEAPIRKAIPYVNKPVDVDPGIANYYASTYSVGNDYCSIVVKTREGRPIKVEGNTLSKVSGGGTTTQVEASVLSLYDERRFRNPKINNEDTDWETIDEKIISELTNNREKTVIISYSNCSLSTLEVIENFKNKYTNVEHVQYDPVSKSALLDAYEDASGVRSIPLYDYSKASTIVSFEADFLGNSPHQTLVNKQFATTRKVTNQKKEMSRLYVFESNLSLTGSNADYRQPIKPSEQLAYITHLYNLLATKAGLSRLKTPSIKKQQNLLKQVANDLWKTKGRSIVVCDINNKDVQLIIIAINNLLDNYGNTIDLNKSINTIKGDDKSVNRLVKEINEGKVSSVIFYNCNPVYDHATGEALADAIKKVKTTISTSDRTNETTLLTKYIVPDHHYLESWNDFEPLTGHLSLSQPTIKNIFNTRQVQQSFLRWTGSEVDYYDFIKDNWKKFSTDNFDYFWDKCLHDGVFEINDTISRDQLSVDIESLTFNFASQNSKDHLELKLYANYSIGVGFQSNNPWLQEMPDPITKACWDNYLTVSPKQAYENNWVVKNGDMDFKLAKLTIGNKTVNLPVLPQPGQAYGTMGLALGYGRKNAGKVADGIGVNAYRFVNSVNEQSNFFIDNVSIDISEKTKKVAQTQTTHTYAGRNIVIQETTLEEYKNDSKSGRYFPVITDASGGKNKPNTVSLWKGHHYNNHHWGMIVDLNSCTGCGTCTIACQAENNVPVVGREEVLNRREMHWIRIDRYYSSRPEEDVRSEEMDSNIVFKNEVAAENPEVVFQPMMCQHCNAAPCETVCPVAATTHSTEGLNMMAYNRCVGTRYCANNCPYKVRRFNWFKYHDNSKFDKNTSMNNDLGKMVLNPDVTVRARGVMEKCSFCVQKIQAGKLQAKKEKRRPMDGEIQPSCAKSCPTQALVFGDMKDTNSEIHKKLKIKELDKGVEAQEERAYHVLEELKVMPNIWYLTKIRNKDNRETSKS